MNFYTEVQTVEETKHLVPNLKYFYKSIFGEDSYYIPVEFPHTDHITGNKKRDDGIIWLPWEHQLWIIEVEWKKDSNFTRDQARALSKSKFDSTAREKLKELLEKQLSKLEKVLIYDKSISSKGVINNIIKLTLDNHVKNDFFYPYIWILLGHENNSKELLTTYEEDLIGKTAANKQNQRYIVTTVRMFRNDFSYYFLLENHPSDNCTIKPLGSTLIQGKFLGNSFNYNLKEEDVSGGVFTENTLKSEAKSKAGELWEYLSSKYHITNKLAVKLRINYPEYDPDDFRINWKHRGPELEVSTEKDNRKVGLAFREAHSGMRKSASNVARRWGCFIDAIGKEIINYKTVERELRSARKKKR